MVNGPADAINQFCRLVNRATRSICDSETETCIHVFLRCSFARQVWALSQICWSDIDNPTLSIETWINSLSVKLSVAGFNLVVMICWTIWWSRNLKLAQRISFFPFKSLALLEAIFLPSCRILKRVCLLQRNQTSWNPPPMNSIKINFHGGLLNGRWVVGLGIIAHDTAGLCLAWSSLQLNRGGSVELAEALATREAIRLAHRFRWPRVILEGDCSTLVHKLSSANLDFSAIGPIVSDIRFFSSFLDSISFSFVKQSGNLATDFLAGCALNQEGDASCLPPRRHSAIYGDLAY
ncbi:hypothetical protein Sango_2868900 [Sesamum angolense]|uniref:RNase H type-1 domain-containing protein n=1 Tax=Sesamum angolense TaxID=2727404 RepID=A0AAE1VWL5_9LAMI|nr:hypothetical protein Sango_2868900 [Sesamum angolense]